jgi:hypothetical protein
VCLKEVHELVLNKVNKYIMIFEGFSDVSSLMFFGGNEAVPYIRCLSTSSRNLLSSTSTLTIQTGGAVGLDCYGLFNCPPAVNSL